MANASLQWVQFGDLHIRDARGDNYLDFLALIEEANEHLHGDLDFAFLPGDNADDGTEDQYRLVRRALDQLKLPVHVITGDHDRAGGTLDLFRSYLETNLHRAVDLPGFRLLFLNVMDSPDPKAFDLDSEQMNWITAKMVEAQSSGLRILLFTHLYPRELATQGSVLADLIQRFRVQVVSMGHTHYNELANDGHTIYSTTRSTGQIEEGPPGFSITAIDDDVVSWKFKQRGVWPFLMITSPADERLITLPHSPRHIVRDRVLIRAKAWGMRGADRVAVSCSIDGAPERAMQSNAGRWELNWDSRDVADGFHHIAVCLTTEAGQARDEISVLVNQDGDYTAPARSTVDYENVIGAYPAKGILGTQLGPNENGTKDPWPCWR